MKFTETHLAGAFLVEIEARADDRGFFARAWCEKEFAERGISVRMVQANLSANEKAGTLRGLHYQIAPHEEAKLVRCTRGAIFDVLVDLRPDSATHGQWFGVELTADNRRSLYVPAGLAHGYQTLVDNTEVFYQVSQFYAPDSERGARWNDPAFGIRWPLESGLTISDKDRNWPDYEPVS